MPDIDLLTKKIVYGILLVLALPVIYFISLDQEFEKSDLTTISGTLKASPRFERAAKRSGYLILNLNEFENEFHTDTYAYHVLKENRFRSQVRKGDKILLSIRNDESVSLVDQINKGMGIVRIIELWTDTEEFISLDDYNSYRRKDYMFIYVFWIAVLGYYIYWLNKDKENSSRTKKSYWSLNGDAE